MQGSRPIADRDSRVMAGRWSVLYQQKMVNFVPEEDGQVIAVVKVEARNGHFFDLFNIPHLQLSEMNSFDKKYAFGSLVYVCTLVTLPQLSQCDRFFEGWIRNSFQFAFSFAESGSPIFSAPLLKDFEQGRILLCFISNSWSSSHSERGVKG